MATNRAGTGTRPGSVARAWRKACSKQPQHLIQPGPITSRNPRSCSSTWSSLKLTYIKWIPTGSIVKRGLISLQANFFNTWTEPGSIIVTRYKLKPKNYRLVSALATRLNKKLIQAVIQCLPMIGEILAFFFFFLVCCCGSCWLRLVSSSFIRW